jgi:tRNA (guanine-N7-)-methyltransferase
VAQSVGGGLNRAQSHARNHAQTQALLTIGAVNTEHPPPNAAVPQAPYPRAIKTFVKRAGRTGPGQARAMKELGPAFIIPYQQNAIDFIANYAINTPIEGQKHYKKVVLEIGFGMGDATAHIAELMPDTLFIGCEVHEPGVGALLKLMGDKGVHNIRILAHDAVQVLDDMVAPGSLDGIHIFFPDPWHKKRHHKRRLIQPPLVAKLVARLKPGGYVHLATDWEPYAQQMLEVLSGERGLQNTSDGFAQRPAYRPLTKFEKRGLRLGHGVWDLVFTKRE